MDKAVPDLDENIREHLSKQGLKPYKPQPIAPNFNPHHGNYWLTNMAIFGICLIGRSIATKQNGPRAFYSLAMCSLPFYYLVSSSKIDTYEQQLGKRKDLDDQLQWSPITRKAWQRALEANKEYQNNLKEEIANLERKLILKNV